MNRVRLDEPFQNEWFRFHLGMHQPSLDCASADRDGDTGETCLPYMVGTEYRFSTRNGEAYRRLAGAGILMREMKWLPGDDRLYVVDGALKTVVEYAGFNVFTEAMLQLRQIR